MFYMMIGLCLIVLWCYIQYLNFRMNKIARKVEGTIVFSNHGVDKNKKGQMIRDYYYTLVEFDLDGVTLRKEIGEGFEEGETITGWYDEKRDLFITEKIRGIHEGKGTNLILFFGLFMLAFDPVLDFLESSGMLLNSLPFLVAFMFSVCGAYVAYTNRPEKLKQGLVPVKAKVMDIKEEWVEKGYQYFPVYVYEYDEDETIFRSKKGRNPIRMKEGDEVELYLDVNTEDIFEKPETSINYKVGLISAIVGIILMLVSMIL